MDEFDMSVGQAHEFVLACRRNGLTAQDVKLLSGGDNLARSLAFLRDGISSLNKIITLSRKSTSELLESGKYDWTNSDVNNKNFPVDPSLDGEWECDLWDPKGFVSSEAAHKACSEDGWSPATAHHELIFGAKYPDAQKVNPIVALGSSCLGGFGDRYVPVLDASGHDRKVFLVDWDGGWNPDCRFLRVRRSAPQTL
jgi:hypothetical protein